MRVLPALLEGVLSRWSVRRRLWPFGAAPDDPRIPPWRTLIARDHELWAGALQRARAPGAPRVLVANTMPGYNNGSVLESVLAAGLVLRAARPEVLVCQGELSACFLLKFRKFSDLEPIQSGSWHHKKGSPCHRCREFTRVFSDLGVEVLPYRRYLSAADVDRAKELSAAVALPQIPGYNLDGCAVGEHALAGALRYFAKGDASDEPTYEVILRVFFRASLETFYAVNRLLDERPYDVAVFHHGIYVPQGIIGEVMRRRGVRVVNWNSAYRKKCFIFSHGDTYHHTLMTEPVAAWQSLTLSPDQEAQILAYLDSRQEGTRDWIWFHNEPQSDRAKFLAQTRLDPGRPIIGMLTNVVWDAQLHYPANAFPSMLDWIRETIAWFAPRPGLQLMIRVHPAEIRGVTPSRQLAVDEIRRWFPQLPDNVAVIGPESEINTYFAASFCNAVLIYGTKTGVELTSRGIPVIVAGEAWIKNKGLTLDASSRAEYFALLERLPLDREEVMPRDRVSEALRYAYHFFFRRMIPLGCFRALDSHKKMPYEVALSSLQGLAPGADPGLDVICDGILREAPFVYPYETRDQQEWLQS